MGVLPLVNCAVQNHDSTWCSPIPNADGQIDQNSLVACDNFLSSNPQLLTPQQWTAMTSGWISQGQAVECTNSQTLGDVKTALEELCGKTSCSYDAQKKALEGLAKLQKLGHH